MRELKDSKGRFVAGHKKVGGMSKGGHQTEEAKNKISASLIGRTAEQARQKATHSEAIGKCWQPRVDVVRNLHGEYSPNRKQCTLPGCHGDGANKEQEMSDWVTNEPQKYETTTVVCRCPKCNEVVPLMVTSIAGSNIVHIEVGE